MKQFQFSSKYLIHIQIIVLMY